MFCEASGSERPMRDRYSMFCRSEACVTSGPGPALVRPALSDRSNAPSSLIVLREERDV